MRSTCVNRAAASTVTVLAMLALLTPPPARAQSAARETDVKATFLFHFAQFVQWPNSALANTNAPFVIGILGSDPFGKFLDDLVKDERIQGRPIHLRRLRSLDDAVHSQILFISKSEEPHYHALFSALKDRPILTVGEGGCGFCKEGGMIELAAETGNIRIRVNLSQARAAGLQISAKLLRLAEILPKANFQ